MMPVLCAFRHTTGGRVAPAVRLKLDMVDANEHTDGREEQERRPVPAVSNEPMVELLK